MEQRKAVDYHEDETKHRFMEYPISPSPNFPIFWDKITWNLAKAYPNHYYVPESPGIRIKRKAKRRVFNYILKISKEILTKGQYEAFVLYYDFYPHRTSEDIARILNTKDDLIRQKLQRARFRIVRYFHKNTKSPQMKDRLGKWLKEYRGKANEYRKKYYRRNYGLRFYHEL